jgi:hypothetical protein
MQRMLLLWSLILGLVLVGADSYIERGRASAIPSYEGGTPATASVSGADAPDIFEDGTPIPPK